MVVSLPCPSPSLHARYHLRCHRVHVRRSRLHGDALKTTRCGGRVQGTGARETRIWPRSAQRTNRPVGDAADDVARRALGGPRAEPGADAGPAAPHSGATAPGWQPGQRTIHVQGRTADKPPERETAGSGVFQPWPGVPWPTWATGTGPAICTPLRRPFLTRPDNGGNKERLAFARSNSTGSTPTAPRSASSRPSTQPLAEHRLCTGCDLQTEVRENRP
jgi:hypothetical protein